LLELWRAHEVLNTRDQTVTRQVDNSEKYCDNAANYNHNIIIIYRLLYIYTQ